MRSSITVLSVFRCARVSSRREISSTATASYPVGRSPDRPRSLTAPRLRDQSLTLFSLEIVEFAPNGHTQSAVLLKCLFQCFHLL